MEKLKNMEMNRLIAALYVESGLNPHELAKLAEAVHFASALHAKQTRKDPVQGRHNTPYIEHPLRNAVRLIRYGIKDLDVLIATVLHDAVEDCGSEYIRLFGPEIRANEVEARALLAEAINDQFGANVIELVLAVTNPSCDKEVRRAMSNEQKNLEYVNNVIDEISGSADVYFIKLSDFLDNAGSLHWTPEYNMKMAQRLSRKYLPLVDVFLSQLIDFAPVKHMTKEVTSHVYYKLELTRDRLNEILEKKIV